MSALALKLPGSGGGVLLRVGSTGEDSGLEALKNVRIYYTYIYIHKYTSVFAATVITSILLCTGTYTNICVEVCVCVCPFLPRSLSLALALALSLSLSLSIYMCIHTVKHADVGFYEQRCAGVRPGKQGLWAQRA